MEGRIPGTDQKVCLRQGGVVKEIKPPELLVYTFAWDSRESVGLSDSPYKENIVTVCLEERGGKTVMHFTQAPFATAAERDGHTGGWNSAFDRFAEFMLMKQPGHVPPTDDVPSELHMKRVFAAPRQMVFDAWTKPEIVAQWWGPTGFTTPVCEIDARSGGALRIHMRGTDGTIYPMIGRIMELYPPYRFHFTSSPLDRDGNPLFDLWNSVFFEEVEGGTQVTLDVHVTMMTREAPQYLKGMTIGWTQTLDRLGKLLGSTN